MNMKRLLLTLFTALLITPVFADEYSEKLKIANEYLALAVLDIDMEAIIDQMWMPIVNRAEANGKTISDEQKVKMRTVYLDTFSEPMLQLMKDQGPIVAEVFTLTEIIALRDFYATEEGRSVMRKMPQLLAKQQPQVMKMVKDKMPTVMPVVQEILK